MKVSSTKLTKCKECGAPLVADCNCPTCLLSKHETGGAITLANLGLCHMCAEMYRAVNSRTWFRRMHQEWLVEQQKIKAIIRGDIRPQLPPPKDEPDGK